MFANAKRFIRYLSKSFAGSIHDFRLLQAEFLPDKDWFKGKKLRLDSAFQGIEEVYETIDAVLPQKKPKNKPMPEEAKELNRQKSQKRVIVDTASQV